MKKNAVHHDALPQTITHDEVTNHVEVSEKSEEQSGNQLNPSNQSNQSNQKVENYSEPKIVSENNFSVILSRTLAKQLNNIAKYEGIAAADLILELVNEGLGRRMMADETRPAPSHLMTRNGYVQDKQYAAQPSMSHHTFQTPSTRNGNTNSQQGGNVGGGTGNGRYPQRRNTNTNNNLQSSKFYFKSSAGKKV